MVSVTVVATVTLLLEALERLPAASTAKTLYVPSASPVAGKLVSVFAKLMATLFHWLSKASVMLVKLLLTETAVLTR